MKLIIPVLLGSVSIASALLPVAELALLLRVSVVEVSGKISE